MFLQHLLPPRWVRDDSEEHWCNCAQSDCFKYVESIRNLDEVCPFPLPISKIPRPLPVLYTSRSIHHLSRKVISFSPCSFLARLPRFFASERHGTKCKIAQMSEQTFVTRTVWAKYRTSIQDSATSTKRLGDRCESRLSS